MWTMNRTHIALYSETGVKVFSKNPNDVHILNEKPKEEGVPRSFESTSSRPQFVSYAFGTQNYSSQPINFSFTTSTTLNNISYFDIQSKNIGSSYYQPPSKSIPPSGGLFNFKAPAESQNQAEGLSFVGNDLQKSEEQWVPADSIDNKPTLDITQKFGGLFKPINPEGNEPQRFKVREVFKGIDKVEDKKIDSKDEKKKPKVELKGTYIKTFDAGRKAYYAGANYHICYDPYNKKFYTLNWIWDSHTNIFPSMISITYDPERYQTSGIHLIDMTPPKMLNECSLSEYATKILEEVILLQRKRFYMPSRLRNWDYIYGWALTDVQNKKNLAGSQDEEGKKKFSNQKAKLQQRLAKVSEQPKINKPDPDSKPIRNRNFSEIKKVYAGCMDGSLETLTILVEMLKQKENYIHQALNQNDLTLLSQSGVSNYFYLLLYWTKHADVLAGYKDKEPTELAYVETLLYNILSHEINSGQNLRENENLLKFNLLCWRILINGWESFVKTSQKQFKWINLILSTAGRYKLIDLKEDLKLTGECINRDGYSPIIYFYLKFAHYPDSFANEFPLKDFQIESVRNIDSLGSNDEQNLNITRRSIPVKIRESNFSEPSGRLLLEDLSLLSHAKVYEYQFEDLYNSYFISENAQALKIEKPKEETTEEKQVKVPYERIRAKGKSKEKKASKETNSKAVLTTTTTTTTTKISIDPEVIKTHKESSKKLLSAFEKVLIEVADHPTNENILCWKIFNKLVLDSWVELEKIEEGEQEWIYKLAHMERLVDFLERVIEHYTSKLFDITEKYPTLGSKVFENITNLVSSICYLVYQSAITKNFGCEHIALGFIKLYDRMRRFLDFSDDKLGKGNILEYLITQNDEGVDYLNEKVIETNHPYERGKVINFDPLLFPGAIAISVEFDKRCQSDAAHDCITLCSGIDSTYSNFGYFMNQRDPVGISFRISGKPNLKKPIVMLGNSLQVDFSSSGQAKDEHSLNRWGFRLKIRPIYGVANYILKDSNYSNILNNIQAKFGGEKPFTDYVSSLAMLNIVIVEIIELHIKGGLLDDKEKELAKYLKWNLLKGGIAGTQVSQFLTQVNGSYQLANKPMYQDLETYSFDDKFDALKEEIYLRISKYSSKKDSHKENEEKLIESLFELKDPLLSTFMQSIKDQKGGFYDLVKRLKVMVPEPMNLRAEKMRKTFLPEYKILWEQAEGYLILAMLYHSGLLKFIVNDKNEIEIPHDPHIRDQLNQVAQRRNEVFSWMLGQIQSEREWQHTLEEISELRNKYIDEKKRLEEEKREKEKQAQEEKKDLKENKKEKEKKAPERSTKDIRAERGSKISVRPSSRPTGTEALKPKKITKASISKSEEAQLIRKQKAEDSDSDEEEKNAFEVEEETKSDPGTKQKEADFEEKLDDIILKELEKRFQGHSEALKIICTLKNIDLDKDSSQLLRDIYEVCKESLKKFKKNQNKHYILDFKSPYETIAKEVIDISTLLIKLNSHFKKGQTSPEANEAKIETSSINELDEDAPQPLNMNRSFSSAHESQIADTNLRQRLEGLRELVSTYQRWKEWHKKDSKESEEYFFHEYASPLKSVVALITSKVSSKDLEVCLKNHLIRSSQRVIGVKMVHDIFDQVINTPFERYLFGLFTQAFSEDYLTNVACAPREFKNIIEGYLFKVLAQFIVSFNNKMETIKSIKLKHLNNILNKSKGNNSGFLRWKSIIQQSLSGLACNLRDIIAIVSNAKILKRLLSNDESKLSELLPGFFENIVLLALLSISLSYLSLECEQLITIASDCIHNITYFIKLVEKSGQQATIQSILNILQKLLKKEIGLSQDEHTHQYKINARILHRANDIIAIDRIHYLLNTSFDLFGKIDLAKVEQGHLTQFSFVCYLLSFHHNAPKILKICRKVCELIAPYVEFTKIPTAYDINYYYYQFTDYDNMLKAGKTQAVYKLNPEHLVLKQIEIPKIESKLGDIKPNNAIALFEKLGDKVLLKNQHNTVSLKNIIDNQLLKSEPLKKDLYSVFVHVGNEEDLTFMVKVLYYWEEKYPTFTLKYPKTVEEYVKYKEALAKKEAESKAKAEKAQSTQIQPGESYFKNNEKIFLNLPDLNLITKDEDELPIAWEFNLLGNLTDGKMTKHEFKRSKTKKNVRKLWSNANLTKIEKKMEEALKTLEEYKDTDPEEEKLLNIQARTFIWRIQQHVKEALYIAAMLNIYGFSPVLDAMPFEKAMELASLIHLGTQKKLKNISVEHFQKEELKKKLDPHSFVPPQQQANAPKKQVPEVAEKDQKSEMKISLCDYYHHQIFEANADFITSATSPKESFYLEVNKVPVFHYTVQSGNATTILINEIINQLRSIFSIEKVSKAVVPDVQKFLTLFGTHGIEELSSFDKSVFVGITAFIGGWTDAIKPGNNIVYEDVTTKGACLLQGGSTSGKKICNIIGKSDHTLIPTTTNVQKIHPKLAYDLPECIKIEPSTIIAAIKLLYQHYEKLSKDKSIDAHLESSLILRAILRVCQAYDWFKLVEESGVSKEDLGHFLSLVMKMAANCPPDKGPQFYEEAFGEAWEALVDKKDPRNHFFIFPAIFPTEQTEFSIEEAPTMATLEKKPSQGPVIVEGLLPNSPYISSLPEYQPLVSEYKMLKHWEKHIIPKIQDFVRSSYKPWEFEEFFEQLRQPLRKGDHHKAAEIAYILCDQRLPNGCVLPDPNHDWSTISIEEVNLGTWAIANISSKQNRNISPFFHNQYRIGNKDLLVLILAADTKTNSVLVHYHDFETLQTLALWVPVSCLKVPEIPLNLPASSYPFETILENYKTAAANSLAFLARGTMFKFFNFNGNDASQLKKESDLMNSYNFTLTNLIKWSVLDELAADPVEGWLDINEWEIPTEKPKKRTTFSPSELLNEISDEKPSKKAKKLDTIKCILQFLAESKESTEIDNIIAWLKDNLNRVVQFINFNAASVDLQKPYSDAPAMNTRPILSLNRCLPDVDNGDETISALSISFKKESMLCMNSGIKFFDDPNGVNMIEHVPAGNEPRSKFPSLVFKQSKIWYTYYFNAEALPPYLQSQSVSTILAVLHAVPSRWSVSLWTADSLGTALYKANNMKAYEQFVKLIDIIVQTLKDFKGPLNLKMLIFRLLNRTMRKFRYLIDSLPELAPKIDSKNLDLIVKENMALLHIDYKFVEDVVKEIKNLENLQKGEVIILYSSYTQELIEYVANCLLPVSYFGQVSLSNSKVIMDLDLPKYIIAVIDTWLLLQFFKGESQMAEDLQRETINNLKLDFQWERAIFVNNLPLEYTKEEIKEKIISIILKHSGRILNPKIDIMIPTTKEGDKEVHQGKCIVLIDGWSAFELEDEPEKEESKEPEEEPPAPEEPEFWQCGVCTLENPRDAPFCEACESPKPLVPIRPQATAAEVVEEVKHTDLAEIDQKLKQRERERLDKIAEDIKAYVNDYYEKIKATVQELEEKEKQRKIEAENKPANLEEIKRQSDLDAEARKQRNREKKQQQKELKKKLQEEKERKRLEKKTKKKVKKDETVDEKKEEKPAEEKKEETSSPELRIETTQESVPEEEKISPEEKERMRLQEILNKQAAPNIILGSSTLTDSQSSKDMIDFLRLRITQDGKTLRPAVVKVLTQIFNTMVDKASIIPSQYKIIQDIDILSFSKMKVEDFIQTVESKVATDPARIWKFLEVFGYDLWLNEASFNLPIESYKSHKMLPRKALEQLMDFVQIDLCKENKTVLNYPPSNIRLIGYANILGADEEKPINYSEESVFHMKYNYLSSFSLIEIRYAWALIKTFNKNLSEAIDFINTHSAIPYSFNARWLNLGTYLSAYRNYWMTPIKIELSNKVMHKTAIARDNVPKVQVERLKINKDKDKEKHTISALISPKEIVSYKSRDEFIFTRAYEQLKDVSATLFRPIKPTGSDPFLAFEVVFKGELVMGEAGPYRQFFADISQELQPNNVSLTSQHKNLNLLCPSPNNYAKLGEGRDKFVINPSANSSYQLQLYEFLGILMGCSVRTGTHLTLDLPTLFWKQLTNQTITIEDLEEVDKPLTDLIRFMGECTKEAFEESIFENYCTMLSDKSIIDLKPGGSKIRVR